MRGWLRKNWAFPAAAAALLAFTAVAGVGLTLTRPAAMPRAAAPGPVYPPNLNNANVYNVQVNGACKGDGVTDDTAAIQSAITAAAAQGFKKLYLPAGTYLISGATGNLFTISSDNMEVFGDGVGKTVIKYNPTQVFTGNVVVFPFTGKQQSLHDLSFVGPASGATGPLTTFRNVVTGGTNYVTGDTITLAGGTFTTAATVTITASGGAITGVSAINNGGSYSVQGVSGTGVGAVYTQGSTSGIGTGGSVDIDGPNLVFHGVNQGALRSLSYNLDISGIWGLNNAGGAGITTFQPPQQDEFSTTLGTTITAGVKTVTPGSMASIYPGRLLRISTTNPETINVTSTTATTFTATFASAHNATDVIDGWSLGQQYNLIQNVFIHDSPQCSATTMNSGSNVIRSFRVVNCGMCNNQHGIYDQQGGRNIFEDCYVEGVSGFSYHVHIAAAGIASAGGNRFVHCYSVNPGNQHLLIDSINGDGTDPDTPSGQPLNRNVVLVGCVFKCTKGANTPSTGLGVQIQTGGAIISDCIFEDACANGNGVMLSMGSVSSSTQQVVKGCVFRVLNGTGSPTGVNVGNNAVCEANQFIGWNSTGAGTPIALNPTPTGQCVVKANGFQYSKNGGAAIVFSGGASNVIIADNQGTVGGNNTTGFISVQAGSITGMQVYGNNIVLSGGAHFMKLAANNPAGQVHDNIWTGSTGGISYTDCPTGLDFYHNNGVLNFNNTSTNCLALDSQAGHLLRVSPGASTLTGGLAVNVAQTGNCATTDTVWSGFAPCNKDTTNGNFFLAGWSGGQVVRGVTADGACTAGHVLILSSTVAGDVHDNGTTTPPAAPASYGIALNTTGGAGAVDIRVMRGQ